MITNDSELLDYLRQNKKMAEKLLRITHLLTNNIKLHKGPRGGLFYYTNNNTKIYISK